MKKLLAISMMSTALMIAPIMPSSESLPVNIAYSWEGEDTWEMINRCLYHSGSWVTSTGLTIPEEAMPHCIRVDSITHSVPAEDFAEGLMTFGILDEGRGIQGRFVMLGGKAITFFDPKTGAEGMRMMRF